MGGIVILVILLLAILFYLVFLELNIRRVKKELRRKRDMDTNGLVTTSSSHLGLKSLIAEINIMMQRYREVELVMERKNKNLNGAIVNISHDLRTPLTSAIGYLDLLENESLTIEERKKYEVIISNKLSRLSFLIDQFFEFTKVVSSSNLPLENVNLTGVLEEAVAGYYEDFSKQGRMVTITGEQNLYILGHVALLKRVFDNLLINAFKHSSSDLVITIEKEEGVLVTFQNALLEEVDLDQLFLEFYTSDVSRTKENTGLGLAIVKDFVERMGGIVSASMDSSKQQLCLTLSFVVADGTKKEEHF